MLLLSFIALFHLHRVKYLKRSSTYPSRVVVVVTETDAGRGIADADVQVVGSDHVQDHDLFTCARGVSVGVKSQSPISSLTVTYTLTK